VDPTFLRIRWDPPDTPLDQQAILEEEGEEGRF